MKKKKLLLPAIMALLTAQNIHHDHAIKSEIDNNREKITLGDKKNED